MQLSRTKNGQMRALAMAMCSAVVTSVIAMIAPLGLFESTIGANGDMARALIAFGSGAFAFVTIATLLLRKPAVAAPVRAAAPKVEAVEEADDVTDDAPSFRESMRARLNSIAASHRDDNAEADLSDLPKLRASDAHPDAPPRRPISAHRDFAEFAAELVIAPVAEPVVPAKPVTIVEPAAVECGKVILMVDRLEAAVTQREQQLAKLEVIAKAEATKAQAAEAVELDVALRSALETLHSMNERIH